MKLNEPGQISSAWGRCSLPGAHRIAWDIAVAVGVFDIELSCGLHIAIWKTLAFWQSDTMTMSPSQKSL